MNSEAKSFYKSLLFVVGPLALQNLISALVNSVDVFMLGSVGQTAIAASSLAGNVSFILFMVAVGLSSGLVMLAAQYWGKQDLKSIQTLVGIALRICSSVGLIFAVATFFFPSIMMRIFTNDPKMIEVGASYLRAVSFSYFFMSISQIFQAAFKSMEKVLFVTALTFISLGMNVILNGCFLYGIDLRVKRDSPFDCALPCDDGVLYYNNSSECIFRISADGVELYDAVD